MVVAIEPARSGQGVRLLHIRITFSFGSLQKEVKIMKQDFRIYKILKIKEYYKKD
jgi:hypothetical protein